MGIGGPNLNRCLVLNGYTHTSLMSSFPPTCGLSYCSPFVTVMNYKSHECTTTNVSLVMSASPAYWNDGECGLALLFSQNTNKEFSLLTDSAWLLSLHAACPWF